MIGYPYQEEQGAPGAAPPRNKPQGSRLDPQGLGVGSRGYTPGTERALGPLAWCRSPN